MLGKMVALTAREKRKEEDFARHVQHNIQIDAAAGWGFIVDNLNIHAREMLVRDVAPLKGLDESVLLLAEECALATATEFGTGRPRAHRKSLIRGSSLRDFGMKVGNALPGAAVPSQSPLIIGKRCSW